VKIRRGLCWPRRFTCGASGLPEYFPNKDEHLRQASRQGGMRRADRGPIEHLPFDQLNAVMLGNHTGRNHLLVTIGSDSRTRGREHRGHGSIRIGIQAITGLRFQRAPGDPPKG